MNRERNARIDDLRGLGIVGVVFIHSIFPGRFTPETLGLASALARCFDWAVLMFFFTSGCLQASDLPFRNWLPKRALSLLVPFFVYNIGYNIVFFALAARGIHDPANHFSHVPPTLLLWPFISPAFQLYFLPDLFAISLLFFCAARLAGDQARWFSGGLTLLVIGYYLWAGFPAFSHGAQMSRIPLYLASFAIGSLMKDFPASSRAVPFAIAGVLAGIVCLAVYHLSAVSLAVPPLLYCALSGSRRSSAGVLLQSLGRQSGSIYLWHTPLLLPALTLLGAHFGTPPPANFFGSVFLSIGICMMIRIGMDRAWAGMFQKPPPRWLAP